MALRVRSNTPTMARAYILLGVKPDALDLVQQRLASLPCVASVDVVEGPADLIVVTQASTFDLLVKDTVDALIAVEEYTERVRCLPVHQGIAR
ncbi:MAG: hypothetical protein HYX82_04250 [Chloroflexi bacterium]|nr:hypothetical protein [Chloroflexota bacterium]